MALVPFQWKLSQLYPIPKPQEWEFNLSNTRPILLLECMRKLAMKVITTRLSTTCFQYNILKGPNFAGLKGDSTKVPIYVLNNLLEDARDNNKELWLAF